MTDFEISMLYWKKEFYKLKLNIINFYNNLSKLRENKVFRYINVNKVEEPISLLTKAIDDLSFYPQCITNAAYDHFPMTSQIILKSKKNDEYNTIEYYAAVENAGRRFSGFEIVELLDKRIAATIYKPQGWGINGIEQVFSWRTLFLIECKKWLNKSKEPNLCDFLFRANDHFSEYSKYMFWTNVSIIDTKRGIINLCDTGYGQMYIFRNSQSNVEKIDLPINVFSVFSNSLLKERNYRYSDKLIKLNYGDILVCIYEGLLSNFRMVKYSNNKDKEMITEEFSENRIIEIINAVNSNSIYTLERITPDNGHESFLFNFTNLEPSAKNTVLAILAVERIFRLHPDPNDTSLYPVKIIPDIVEILQKTFNNFNNFFSNRIDNDYKHIYFSHLFEEGLWDDDPSAFAIKFFKDSKPSERYFIDGKEQDQKQDQDLEYLETVD